MGISLEAPPPCGLHKGQSFRAGTTDGRLDCPAIRLGPDQGNGARVIVEKIDPRTCQLMRSDGNEGAWCPVAGSLALEFVREWAEEGFDQETIEAELRTQPYSERFWGLAQAYLEDHFAPTMKPVQS